jgi:hypothetical protein
VDIFDGLDEMGLTENEVGSLGLFDFHSFQFHDVPSLCSALPVSILLAFFEGINTFRISLWGDRHGIQGINICSGWINHCRRALPDSGDVTALRHAILQGLIITLLRSSPARRTEIVELK